MLHYSVTQVTFTCKTLLLFYMANCIVELDVLSLCADCDTECIMILKVYKMNQMLFALVQYSARIIISVMNSHGKVFSNQINIYILIYCFTTLLIFKKIEFGYIMKLWTISSAL